MGVPAEGGSGSWILWGAGHKPVPELASGARERTLQVSQKYLETGPLPFKEMQLRLKGCEKLGHLDYRSILSELTTALQGELITSGDGGSGNAHRNLHWGAPTHPGASCYALRPPFQGLRERRAGVLFFHSQPGSGRIA